MDFKILLVGLPGTGKTSVIYRYEYNKFIKAVDTFIAPEFLIKYVIREKRKIKLQIWDYPNKKSLFDELYKKLYSECDAVIYCIDMTKIDTLDTEDFKKQLAHVKEYSPNVFSIVACTKTDAMSVQITNADMEYFMLETECGYYHEVSALSGSGVDEMFDYVTDELVKKKKSHTKSKCIIL
jgi:small GTP-binding protein